MLINLFEEISWQDFIKRPEIQDKSLNEQESYYKQYLQDLNIARQNWTNYQNSGPLASLVTQPETSGEPVSCIEGMDVVFLIDFTSSMGSYINTLKTNILSIVNTIIQESAGDYRLGLVLFDEKRLSAPGFPSLTAYETVVAYTSLPASQRYINQNPSAVSVTNPYGVAQYITAVEAMSTQNSDSFTTQLNLINTAAFPLGSGAGGPEPGGIGYEQILDGIAGSFRSGVSKLVILITDAVPGGDDDFYTQAIDGPYLEGLATRGYQENIQVLVLSRQNEDDGTGYKILTAGTNGSYISDPDLLPSAIQAQIENICEQNA